MKKITAILLALCLAAGILPMTTLAAEKDKTITEIVVTTPLSLNPAEGTALSDYQGDAELVLKAGDAECDLEEAVYGFGVNYMGEGGEDLPADTVFQRDGKYWLHVGILLDDDSGYVFDGDADEGFHVRITVNGVELPEEYAFNPRGGSESLMFDTLVTVSPAIAAEGIAPEASGTAYASAQTVLVDGKEMEFQMYALKDAAGGITNYIRLRDLADVLDWTAAKFNVAYSEDTGSMLLEAGKGYTDRNGTEGTAPFTGEQPYVKASSAIRYAPDWNVDVPAKLEMDVFVINDENGGGHTYFKLRDLAQVIGFNVGWSAEKGVYVETDKPYTNAD